MIKDLQSEKELLNLEKSKLDRNNKKSVDEEKFYKSNNLI